MAHALLAMVNPVLGIYTLMVAVPIGAIFSSSVFMNVSSTAALSVALVSCWRVSPGQQAEADHAGAAGGAIQLLAGLFRLGWCVRLQRRNDRLSQRRGGADRTGPVG
jgi:SulP family sulfate permease